MERSYPLPDRRFAAWRQWVADRLRTQAFLRRQAMESSKKWYKSKGVWGGVIAVLAGLAGSIWGIDVSAEAQDKIASHLPTLIGAVGGLIGVIGRLTAKDKVE